MRLEVLVDQQDPLIFPLNKERILIGSGESCDILLAADGISRKHVIVISNEDDFYVIDQGSTNGTFINEERLVPGKRVEFTSFFPVRLGANVLLTLLSDEESQDYELASFNVKAPQPEVKEEDTRVLSSMEVKEQTNLGINLHRKKASVRNKTQEMKPTKTAKKKEDGQFHLVVIASVVVILIAIFIQLSSSEDDYYPPVETVQAPLAPEAAPPEPVEEVIPMVSKEHIRNIEDIAHIKNDFKCMSNVEKEICDAFDLSAPSGATQVALDVYIFTEVNLDEEFIESIKEFYGDENENYPPSTLIGYFLNKYHLNLSDEFNDYRLHLYFLDQNNNSYESMSFYPAAFKKFKEEMPENFMESVIYQGETALKFTQKYFNYHKKSGPPTK